MKPKGGNYVFELPNYDPRLGKWLSPDPYQQHWSPYLAMGNNPVSFIDPDGGRDYEWYNGSGAAAAAAAQWNPSNNDRASELWEQMNRVTLLVDGQEVGYNAFRGYASGDNIEFLIDGSIFGYGGAYNSETGIRGVVKLIDERRPGYYYSKGYNYGTSIMGLIGRTIDRDYVDPIFDYAGNFLGHYGDSDFNGEIMLMDRATYNNLTGNSLNNLTGNTTYKQKVVLSYDLAESNGVYLKDYLSNRWKKDVSPSGKDLKFLSELYTNLLIEADNRGIMKFDKNDLYKGLIGISAGDAYSYPRGHNYGSAIANHDPGPDGTHKVRINIAYS